MSDNINMNITVNKDIIGLITLRTKYSPVLIPIVFWVFSAISLIAGLRLMLTGGFWLGLIVLIGFPVLARIVAESLMAISEIAQTLRSPQQKS